MKRIPLFFGWAFLSATACDLSGVGIVREGTGGFGGTSPAPPTSSSGGAGGARPMSASTATTSPSSSSSATSAGSGTGGSMGTGGSPPTVSWKVYDYQLKTGNWQPPKDLSSVFPAIANNDPHAPPATGWLAATYLSDLDRLLVFASDGLLYRYDANAPAGWAAPETIASRFAGSEVSKLRSAAQIPHTWSLAWDPNADKVASITLVLNPSYRLYHYDLQTAATTLIATGNLSSNIAAGEPDRKNGLEDYAFYVFDLSKKGTPDGFNGWTQYDDGRVYRIDATAQWSNWVAGLSPFWKGKSNAPPVSGLQAAYTDTKLNKVRIIGP